jgi:transcriptional regulator with XRE-family HTH domain
MSNRVTNQSVADVLNLDQSYVSLIRRGLRVPSREVVARMLAAYQPDPSDFMAAYLNPDPHVFMRYFNQVVGFDSTEDEPVQSETQ